MLNVLILIQFQPPEPPPRRPETGNCRQTRETIKQGVTFLHTSHKPRLRKAAEYVGLAKPDSYRPQLRLVSGGEQ